MTKAIAAVVVASMLVGGSAFADDNTAAAGILPTSRLYWLDRAIEESEKVAAWLFRAFAPTARADLHLDLLDERSAEARAVGKDQGFLSDEYRAATGRYIDAVYSYILTENQVARDDRTWYERLETFRRLNEDLAQERLRSYRIQATDEMLRLDVLKRDIRKDVEEKARAGDPLAVDRALMNLQRVRAAQEKLIQDINNGTYLLDIQQIIEEKQQQTEMRAMEEKPVMDEAIQKIRRDRVERFIKRITEEQDFLIRTYVPRPKEGELAVFEFFKKFDEKIETLRALFKDGVTDEEMMRVVNLEEEIQEELERVSARVHERATQAEEKAKPAAEKAAEKDAVKRNVKKDEPGFWSPFPRLRPLGIPNPSTLGSRIVFTPQQTQFTTTIGVPFAYSFCRPSVGGQSDLCPASSTVPRGGNPPYHFRLDTGVGFPPFGMRLNLNGLLDGTPKAEGSRTFGVCAMDLAGRYDCKNVTVTVRETPKDPKDSCFPDYGRCHDACARRPSNPPEYERERCLENCNWRYDICQYNQRAMEAEYRKRQQDPDVPPSPPPPPPPSPPPSLDSCLELALHACRRVYSDPLSSQQAKDTAYAICAQAARANCPF